jgi:hypothetical protein
MTAFWTENASHISETLKKEVETYGNPPVFGKEQVFAFEVLL